MGSRTPKRLGAARPEGALIAADAGVGRKAGWTGDLRNLRFRGPGYHGVQHASSARVPVVLRVAVGVPDRDLCGRVVLESNLDARIPARTKCPVGIRIPSPVGSTAIVRAREDEIAHDGVGVCKEHRPGRQAHGFAHPRRRCVRCGAEARVRRGTRGSLTPAGYLDGLDRWGTGVVPLLNDKAREPTSADRRGTGIAHGPSIPQVAILVEEVALSTLANLVTLSRATVDCPGDHGVAGAASANRALRLFAFACGPIVWTAVLLSGTLIRAEKREKQPRRGEGDSRKTAPERHDGESISSQSTLLTQSRSALPRSRCLTASRSARALSRPIQPESCLRAIRFTCLPCDEHYCHGSIRVKNCFQRHTCFQREHSTDLCKVKKRLLHDQSPLPNPVVGPRCCREPARGGPEVPYRRVYALEQHLDGAHHPGHRDLQYGERDDHRELGLRHGRAALIGPPVLVSGH